VSNYPHLRQAQRAVWRKASGLSAAARSIGAYLMNRMNDDYTGAFPSAKKIAEDTGYSVDVVYDATAELIASGLFARERGEGLRGAYVYRIANFELLAIAIEKYTSAEKAKRDVRLAARGRPQPHVADSQGSPTATSTPGPQPEVPLAASLREGVHLSAQRSAQEVKQPAGSRDDSHACLETQAGAASTRGSGKADFGMNGSEAMLVKRLVKLMGEYGDEDEARSNIISSLRKAEKNKLIGSPVGRLAIALEDMERKKDNFGDPSRMLYPFMANVDPARADARAKSLHAKPRWAVDPNKTVEQNLEVYLVMNPQRVRDLERHPGARQALIDLIVSKGARHA
jgi:hypothetical protein